MRAAWFICLFLALAFLIDVHEAKRRSGGSRRGSSSSSSGSGGWFSSSNKNSNSGYPKQNNYGNNNYGEYPLLFSQYFINDVFSKWNFNDVLFQTFCKIYMKKKCNFFHVFQVEIIMAEAITEEKIMGGRKRVEWVKR